VLSESTRKDALLYFLFVNREETVADVAVLATVIMKRLSLKFLV